ncbi:hypothetical protein OCU04_003169 [Sclerotinia nivalis]|uniref:Uncharacterized protein n=1 Tax=Sclerotinia nivalis TaxID=352851 RepID=A0A9X0AW59_9HELO|nr:hypothetical protein OCU04_003169 [Sclerotinia nivalis]
MRQFEKSNSSLSVTRGRERPQSAVFSAPRRMTRSNAPTERDSSEDTDLDADSTDSSEAVEDREPDSPRATHDQISSAGKNTQILDSEISDSFDSDDDEEPEPRNSPLHLASLIETNNPDLSTVGRGRSSTKSLGATSEVEELAMAERNHTNESIRESSSELVEDAVILSEESIHQSNLKMDMRLGSSFGVNRETLEANLKEDATFSSSKGEIRDSSKTPSTPSSCTDDIDLGNQEILSSEKWCLTGECGTTDVVFESPRLIPERRESQLYLVNTEDEEAEESEADGDHSVEVNYTENVNAEKAEKVNAAEGESTEMDENEKGEMDLYESIEAGHDDNFQMKEDERHDVDNEDAVEVHSNEGIGDAVGGTVEEDNDNNDGVKGKEATEAKKDNNDEFIDRATTETENCDGDEVMINRYVEVENEENVENHDNEILEKWISCEGPINETAEVERDETIEFDDNGNGQPRVEEDVTIDESTEGCGEKTKVVENDDSIEVTGKEASGVENQKGVDINNNKILEDSGLIFDVAVETPVEAKSEDSIQLDDQGKLQVTEIRKEELAIEEEIEVQSNKITEVENEESIEVDIDGCFQVRGADKDITMGECVEGICGDFTAVAKYDSLEVDEKGNLQSREVEEKVIHGGLITVAERPKHGPAPEAEQEVVNLNESMEIDSDNTAEAENDDSKMNLQDEEVRDNQTTVVEDDGNIDADYLDYSPVKEFKQERDTMNEDIEVDSDETAEAENEKSIPAADKSIDTQEERQNSRTIQSGDEFKDPFSNLTDVQEPRSKFGNEGVPAGSFPWKMLGNPSIFSLRKAQQQDRGDRLKMQSEENRDLEVQDEMRVVSTEFAED